MGYPSQPQDPHGQQQPQPYGYSGPQPTHGYGYQPPTSPPPQPPRRNNTGLIVLLAVGIPLLLLGGCGAVVLVLGSATKDAVVTEADSPNLVIPSKEPAESQPAATGPTQEQAQEQTQEQPKQEQSTATIGGSITLEGTDPGLKMAVTLNQVFNPATSAEDYMKPKTGTKLVALQVTLANVGQAVYSDAPTNGALLIDGEGQQYRSTFYDVREGQGINGSATIAVGDSRKGVIVYEVPESAKLAKFQFGLNSGFARQKGEWTLS